jgi:hypothetical protein
MVLVETERLFVRQWVPDDWKRFRPLGTDPRVLEFLNTEPWSGHHSRAPLSLGVRVRDVISGFLPASEGRVRAKTLHDYTAFLNAFARSHTAGAGFAGTPTG